MTGQRTEAAVQRIESALARIARAAETNAAPRPTVDDAQPTQSVLALVEQHEALREVVAQAIADIDSVLREIEA